MTAPPRTLPDFSTLDRHIADALVVLRFARAASTRSRNSETIRAEEDAESRLNGLLECRHAPSAGNRCRVNADVRGPQACPQV